MVKTYAVIGDPIDHTLSPNIHNAAFKELGLDCTYIAYRIPKGELEEGLESLKKIKIAGFNVTIPHKIEIVKYLDKVSDEEIPNFNIPTGFPLVYELNKELQAIKHYYLGDAE